jgi:hypothetical protein
VRFTTAGTYNLSGATVSGTLTLTNTSGGNVTAQVPYGVTIVNTGPNITVVVKATVTFASLLNDTYVRLYNETQATEINLSTVSGGAGYSHELTIGTGAGLANVGDVLRIDAALYRTSGVIYRMLSTSAVLAATGISFIGTQESWSVLETIHDKGSTYEGPNVTGFTLDVPNIEVDSAVVEISGWKLATWLYYQVATTANGMRNYFGAFTDLNLYNFEVDSSAVNLKIDNTGSPATWIDAAWSRSDGASIVATGSATIQFSNGLIQVGINGEASDVWSALAEGNYTYAQVMQILSAVAAGKTDITGSTVTFRDINDTADRVVAEMTGSERTTVTLDVD